MTDYRGGGPNPADILRGPLATLRLNENELVVLLRALALASSMPLGEDALMNQEEFAAHVWQSPYASPTMKSLATALAESIIEVHRGG